MRLFLSLVSITFIVLVSCNSPKSNDSEQSAGADTTSDNATPAQQTATSDTSEWQTYTNNEYNFSMQFPSNWRVVENNVGGNFPIINVYSTAAEDNIDLPMDVHADATVTHVSFFPKGFGTEMPSGDTQKLAAANTDVPGNVALNAQETTLFSLENGAVWGYFLVPDAQPVGWNNGFFFAQIAVNNFEAKCFDKESGEEKNMQNCDPLMGDQFERYGTLNKQAQTQVQHILESIKFTEEQKSSAQNEAVLDLIQVEKPLPNEDIQSPMTVTGKARGMWYFEGDFQILLKDKDDNVLARTPATAQGPWMTEDFVPFVASLAFEAPDDERGELVLQRANPSGKPENNQTYSIPVLFPPKQ